MTTHVCKMTTLVCCTSVLLLAVFNSGAKANVIVEFQATVSGGTYNGNSIAGETLTVTFNFGDATPNICCAPFDQVNEFHINDPAVTNTFNITGPNGGTFSQDVFMGGNFVQFNDAPGAANDTIATRLGNVNSNHFTGSAEYLGPGDLNLDGTIPTLASVVILNNFNIGSNGFAATTIQGGGNTLFLNSNSFSNQSVTLTVTSSSVIPEPSAAALAVLATFGLALAGWRRRRRV